MGWGLGSRAVSSWCQSCVPIPSLSSTAPPTPRLAPPNPHPVPTPTPQDDSTGFAQLTVKFPSRQRFAAYSRTGRLVAGSETADVPVVDHWVFEIPLRKQASNRWRLAGRLTVPPPGAAPPQQQVGSAEAPAGQQQQAQQQRLPRRQQQQWQEAAKKISAAA